KTARIRAPPRSRLHQRATLESIQEAGARWGAVAWRSVRMSITRRKERKAVRTGTSIVVRHLLGIAVMWAPGLVHGQTLTLQQAIEAAEANNRAIRAARLESAKALSEVNVERTSRMPSSA